MLDELVLHLPLQIISLNIDQRQTISHILHKMKPVQFVLYSHVKRDCDGAFLYLAAYMQILVAPTIGQAVYQRGVAVEGKDDVLVLGERAS